MSSNKFKVIKQVSMSWCKELDKSLYNFSINDRGLKKFQVEDQSPVQKSSKINEIKTILRFQAILEDVISQSTIWLII